MTNEFNFKKKYGQNFLKDDNILNNIIKVSDIENDSLIIEIGPGNGALTEKLLNTNNQVISFEIDKDLEPILLNRFIEYNNFKLVMGDFLKTNVDKYINDYKYNKIYVIANLPYYITTPIIEKIINEVDVYKLVIMVQKEVGDRFSALPGTKDYSSITVFLNYYFNIKKEFIVKRTCFVPSPNVDSVILSLTKKERTVLKDINKFNKLLRDAFQFKRKNIKNNLKNYNLEIIEDILKKYNFDLNARSEQLSLDIFIDIANNI